MEKVIVAILTYNLKNYITQALDSVLAQKTSFDYKIIVADDASTDGTVEILKDYQHRYPEKIELILRKENVGSLVNSNRVFDKIDCEYFTLLDGDDYWLGEDRLQAQVDFLDANKKYSMIGGNTQMLRDGVPAEMLMSENELDKSYTFQDMLNYQMPFVHTSSILVRNTIFKDGLPQCYFDAEETFENCALRGEDFRRMLHLEKGPIYVMPESLSIYRIHEQGIWQGSKHLHRSIEALISVNFFHKYYGDRCGDYFAREIRKAYRDVKKTLQEQERMWEWCTIDRRDIQLLSDVLLDLSDRREELVKLDDYTKEMHFNIRKQAIIAAVKKAIKRCLLFWK